MEAQPSVYWSFDWRTNHTLLGGGCLLVWTGNVSAGYDQRRLEKDDIASTVTTTVDSILSFDVQSQLNFIWFLQKGRRHNTT